MGKKVMFNESQLEELKQMMNDGIRQTDIAKHFKVTDDTIRRICRENEIQVRMPHKCKCIICGDVFYSNIRGTKTCKKEHHRTCIICGKDFIVDRTDIRDTCSRKCTCLSRYDVDHASKVQQTTEKRIATVREKYGVDNVSQLADHQEKSRMTCLGKYGSISYAGSEEGRARIRVTNLEKYGVEELLGDPEYRNKLFAINKEKYGTEHPTQTEEIKAKIRQTNIERYGTANVMGNPEIQKKWKQNFKDKHGYSHPMQDPEIKQKLSQTCQEQYGVPWSCMRPEARNYTARSKVNRAFEQKLVENNIEYVCEFVLDKYSFDFKCGNVLIEINPTVTHNSAINIFPGLDPLDSHYHLNKTNTAIENGYRCINIFDWDSWDAIIDLLKSKEVIYARNCKLQEIPNDEASRFINKHHIQGQCKGATTCLGLFYKDELVEVMTFGKPRYNRNYDIELLRLCSRNDAKIIGGASKLFKHYIKNNPGKSILSYCDASKFSGAVYTAIGMTLEYQSDPAKIWSKKTDYITDNLLRQRGYDQLFNTDYGKGTSNEELMLENGWLPIYDCGQKVFSYK